MEKDLPNRRPPSAQSFDTRPGAIETWIQNLPILNAGDTSRQLYNALLEMNALDIETQQRYQALELLRNPIGLVIDGLKKHYLGQDFPLTPKARKVADLTAALYQQLATGYRITVAEESPKGRFRRDNKLLAAAIHRAMSALGMVLVKSFQVYSPYPPHIWREIHELYRQAENQKLLNVDIKQAEEASASTVSGLYKQIMLLALACPYRLRQGAVENIYIKLKDWSSHASLTGLTTTGNANGIFVTNLASDDPPSYLILRHTKYNREDCRLLITNDLADCVGEELAQVRKKGVISRDPDALHESVLLRLMLAWGVMPKRRYTRKEKPSTAIVAMGLSASHYFISGEQLFSSSSGFAAEQETPVSNPAHYEAEPTRAEQLDTPDLWELDKTNRHTPDGTLRTVEFSDAARMSYAPEKQPEKPPAEPVAPPAFNTREWQMVDVSAGGYRLLWDSHDNAQAEVGELIGIRDANDPDTFHLGLGVIRWMKAGDERGLELGVQMISPGAVAVGARQGDARKGSDYMRCLLLPEIAAIGQPATLITPNLPFHIGDVMLINSHGKEVRVELTKLVENTGAFAQFQFRPLEPSQPKGRGDEAEKAASDFDALWAEL